MLQLTKISWISRSTKITLLILLLYCGFCKGKVHVIFPWPWQFTHRYGNGNWRADNNFEAACAKIQRTLNTRPSLSLRRHAHRPLAKRLMHMAHLSLNTSGVSKSSSDWLNYTGFPGDVCVALSNVPPGNKDAVTPNPLTKEESRRVYKCDDERLSGSNKCWIFKSMWNI